MGKKTRTKVLIVLIVTSFLFLIGCSSNNSQFSLQPLLKNDYQLEYINIEIPNCQREYNLLYLSDLHLIVVNDEIADDQKEMVQDRLYTWTGNAPLLWKTLPDELNSCHADMLLFGGDMIDLCTTASVELLKDGFEKLQDEFMYVRADHDTGTHWQKDQNEGKRTELQNALCENTGAMYKEFPDFVLLGINNNTSQLSEEGLQISKEAFALGKPIIILAHVPYYSTIDPSLQEISREKWEDRALVWGQDTSYIPNETTQELMDMIYAKDSPVVQVLCGHLHFSWDGLITDKTREHVFAPGFERHIGVITIKEKSNAA